MTAEESTPSPADSEDPSEDPAGAAQSELESDSTAAPSPAAQSNSAQSNSAQSKSSQSNDRARPRRRKRYVLAVVALLALFAPQLATWLGKGWFERRLSAETHFDLDINSLSASWWSGIKVRGVDVRTASGVPVAHLDELRTQKSAWGLMTAGIEKGKIYINGPHVTLDLSEEPMAEVVGAVSKIKVNQGLLRRILQPDRDKRVNFVVNRGLAEIKPRGMDEFQTIVRDAAPSLHLTRAGEELSLEIDPGEICQLEVSPALCDLGLEYVLPVLAGAVNADGVCHLRLHSCDLDLQDLAATEAAGELFVDSIRAEVEGPLIGQISSMVAQAASLPSGPLILHITENCPVEFAVTNGVVHHDGLKFGLPRVLPSLVLQTNGGIAFDQTLDLRLEAVLPFEDMGEGAALQKLGSPALSIPIAGTLSAPKVEVGDGQVVKGLVRDVVKSLTDDQVDPSPLLDQIGELGLLQKLRDRREAKRQDATSEESANSAAAGQIADGESDDASDADREDNRPRLLQRIRERRQRNRDSRGGIDQP